MNQKQTQPLRWYTLLLFALMFRDAWHLINIFSSLRHGFHTTTLLSLSFSILSYCALFRICSSIKKHNTQKVKSHASICYVIANVASLVQSLLAMQFVLSPSFLLRSVLLPIVCIVVFFLCCSAAIKEQAAHASESAGTAANAPAENPRLTLYRQMLESGVITEAEYQNLCQSCENESV